MCGRSQTDYTHFSDISSALLKASASHENSSKHGVHAVPSGSVHLCPAQEDSIKFRLSSVQDQLPPSTPACSFETPSTLQLPGNSLKIKSPPEITNYPFIWTPEGTRSPHSNKRKVESVLLERFCDLKSFVKRPLTSLQTFCDASRHWPDSVALKLAPSNHHKAAYLHLARFRNTHEQKRALCRKSIRANA